MFWTVPALRYYRLCLCLLSFKQYKTDHLLESRLNCCMHVQKRYLLIWGLCLCQSLMLVFYIRRCVLKYTRLPNVKTHQVPGTLHLWIGDITCLFCVFSTCIYQNLERKVQHSWVIPSPSTSVHQFTGSGSHGCKLNTCIATGYLKPSCVHLFFFFLTLSTDSYSRPNHWPFVLAP